MGIPDRFENRSLPINSDQSGSVTSDLTN